MKRKNVLHQLQTVGKPLDGMSYVIECDDGSLVVIDGSMVDDAPILLDYLKNLSGGEKPEVAAWFITHPHADHFFCLTEMGERYSDQLTLKKLIYHFPDESIHGMQSDIKGQIERFEAAIDRFEGVERVVCHAGDHFVFGSADFEILYTAEDHPPLDQVPLETVNDASLAFRLTVKGQRILFLGDVEVQANRVMIDRYGKDLKSDICQVAHHGFVSSTAEFYSLVDPEILLWPCNEKTFLVYALGRAMVSRYFLTKLHVKEVHLAARGTVSLELPAKVSENPFMPEVPNLVKDPEPVWNAAFARILPDLKNPSDPAWERATPFSLVETLDNATEASCRVRLLWTKDALWFCADYKKELIPSDPSRIGTLNTTCLRFYYREKPTYEVIEWWEDDPQRGDISNLKFYPEKKEIKGQLTDCSNSDVCEYHVTPTDGGYCVCAKVPFTRPQRSGNLISLNFEASGVDVPGQGRTSVLMGEKEVHCFNAAHPAALQVVQLL